jgi:hypothetical protein
MYKGVVVDGWMMEALGQEGKIMAVADGSKHFDGARRSRSHSSSRDATTATPSGSCTHNDSKCASRTA